MLREICPLLTEVRSSSHELKSQILRSEIYLNDFATQRGADDDDFDGLVSHYARCAIEVEALLPSGGDMSRWNSRSSLSSSTLHRSNTDFSLTSRTPTRVTRPKVS